MKNFRAFLAAASLYFIASGCAGTEQSRLETVQVSSLAELSCGPLESPKLHPSAEDVKQGNVLPLDLKELPTSVTAWADKLGARTVQVGDTAVYRVYKRYNRGTVGLHARSVVDGSRRWRATLSRVRYLQPICDKRVAAFQNDRITTLEALTGQVSWELPVAAAFEGCLNCGVGGVVGCDLLLFVAPQSNVGGKLTLDGGRGSEAVLLDGESGDLLWRSPCGDSCYLLNSDDRAIVLTNVKGFRVLSRDTGKVLRVEDEKMRPWAFVNPKLGIFHVEDELRGIELEAEGRARWHRKLFGLSRLERIGDDVIIFTGSTLQRLDLNTGANRWSLELGTELAEMLQRSSVRRLAGESHLLFATYGAMNIVVVVNIEVGRIEALRLAPGDLRRLLLTREIALLVDAEGEATAFNWRADGPVLRSTLSLEDDVERSLMLLATGQDAMLRPRINWVAPADFPNRPGDALWWLERLMPLASGQIAAELDRINGPQVRLLARILAHSPETTGVLLPALRRTYVMEPTVDQADTRRAIIENLGVRFPPSEAPCLTQESLRWLETITRQGWPMKIADGTCAPRYDLDILYDEQPPPLPNQDECDAALAALSTIKAARATLEKAVASPRLLEQFAQFAFGPPRELDCGRERTEEEEATFALLQHMYAFNLSPPGGPIAVEDPTCLHIQTLGGALELTNRVGEPTGWVIDPPHAVERCDGADGADGGRHHFCLENLLRGDAEWDEAPTLWFHVWWQGAPLAGQGEGYVLKKVRDRWRVVERAVLWVSCVTSH